MLLPGPSLIIIYKAFIRPQLDYCGVVFDQGFNNPFRQMFESIQCNAALAILVAIWGTSRERLFQELGFESFNPGDAFGSYLTSIYSWKINHHLSVQSDTKAIDCLFFSNSKSLTNNSFSKNMFFPSPIIEWNKLDWDIWSSRSHKIFKNRILEFTRPHFNTIFKAPRFLSLTYLIRVRVGLSHLRVIKFGHNFRNSLNPIYSWQCYWFHRALTSPLLKLQAWEVVSTGKYWNH